MNKVQGSQIHVSFTSYSKEGDPPPPFFVLTYYTSWNTKVRGAVFNDIICSTLQHSVVRFDI